MHTELLPRERLLQYGEQELSNEELLAVVLRTGTKGCPVLEMSHLLLRKFGNSLQDLCNATVSELCEVSGMGHAKALELSAAFALARRLSKQRQGIRPKMSSPVKIAEFMHEVIGGSCQEEFYVLLMDCKCRLQRCELITQGLLDKSLVHAREVFRPAIRDACSSIVLCHNHPSGDATPSDDDFTTTNTLCAAGRIVGIKIIDHIIVASNEKGISSDSFYSFAANGKMPK